MAESPPTRRRRGPQDPATDTNLNGSTIDQAGDIPPRHGSPFCRWRHFDMARCRREQAELKRRVNSGSVRFLPSTFGLSDDELRRHANTLVLEHGWSVAEVVEVLDVEPGRQP